MGCQSGEDCVVWGSLGLRVGIESWSRKMEIWGEVMMGMTTY